MTVAMGTRCPLCGGWQVEGVVTANIYHELFGCEACGHVFVPLAALDAEENQKMQLQYFGKAFSARNGLFVCLYERINARRTARALGRERCQRVLEIGPGSGAVMAWFARLGHNISGLDMSPAVARQIECRWGLPVTVASLDAHIRAVGEGVYDVIVMRHVLEHFTDPYEALLNTYALLKPGGRLYVAVPNTASWHKRFQGWSGYQPYHFHYFNHQSLSFALSRAGFRVTGVTSYESLTGWVNTFLYSFVCQKRVGVSAEVSKGGCKRQLLETVRLATGIFLSPVRWFQSLLGRGEELVAVGEKAAG
ncbi:MAG: class I SAM-dependent methyltransferase [Chloroflexota bacterium]